MPGQEAIQHVGDAREREPHQRGPKTTRPQQVKNVGSRQKARYGEQIGKPGQRLFEVNAEPKLGIVDISGAKVIAEFKLDTKMIFVPVIDAATDVGHAVAVE